MATSFAFSDLIPPFGGVFSLYKIQGDKSMGETLKLAYAEYLQRMLDQSDDLVEVAIDSVPDDIQCSLTWLEWADFV
jgi:predicted amidophosphoribosyltransferase